MELELAKDEFKDGWTVLGGFEYCAVNRFLGMEVVEEPWVRFLGKEEDGEMGGELGK